MYAYTYCSHMNMYIPGQSIWYKHTYTYMFIVAFHFRKEKNTHGHLNISVEHICIHLNLYACNICIHIHLLNIYIDTPMYILIYTYGNILMYICFQHIRVHTRPIIWLNVLLIGVYSRLYNTHTHTHVYTHIQTHTPTRSYG